MIENFELPPPGPEARVSILRIHSRKKKTGLMLQFSSDITTVTQEAFAVVKVRSFFSLCTFFGADYIVLFTGTEKEPRREYLSQQAVFIDLLLYSFVLINIMIQFSMLYGS